MKIYIPSTQKLAKLKTHAFCILLVCFSNGVLGQNVSYEIVENDVRWLDLMHIRPYVSFCIPPTDLVKDLPIILTVDAQYWAEKIDFRGGLSYGNVFMGGSVGATYHLKKGIKRANHKFVISRTKSGKTETTKFLRAKADIHRISGPCVDLNTGVWKNAGFVAKLDFGWDIQTLAFARAKINGSKYAIKSSRNGWFSTKIQGVLANVVVDETNYFKLGAGTGKVENNRKMAVGFQIYPSVAVAPWRTVTFFASMPMGYMRYLGMANAPETSSKGIPIFSINLGASIGI